MATRGIAHTIQFVAWDTSANSGKTGDGANFTMRWVKDGTSSALTTTTVTEIDSTNCPGLYKVSISSTEADCNIGTLAGKSSTADISIMPVTIQFERLPDAAAGAASGVAIVGSAMTLASGAIVSGTFGAGAITAASIAADAITDAKVASDVTIASVTGSVGSIAAGGISAASFAAGAIDASAIAADAIGASELAADAIMEIQAGLSTLDAAGVRTAVGLAAANLDMQLSGISTKTTNLPSDPADASDIVAAFSTVNSNITTVNTNVTTVNSKLGTPAGASMSADIAAVKTDTGDLVSRITSTLFSGITSLGNWLRLMARKGFTNSTALGEINTGGTSAFDATTDSLEAIRDRGDAAWVTGSGGGSGGGSGAYTLTITVNDGTNPLQNAVVRFTEGVNTFSQTTNASGVATFALDAATYSVAITKAGYQFTPTTLAVSATDSHTYSMMAITTTPPATPGQSVLTGTCYGNDGVAEVGVTISFRMTEGPGDDGNILSTKTRTTTSGVSGAVSLDGFIQGATYEAWRGTGKHVSKVIPATASFSWPEILGSP